MAERMRYSSRGRGRGALYAGRGGGFRNHRSGGRGRGSSSMAWVRSRSSSNEEMQASETTPSSRGPILRGPRTYGGSSYHHRSMRGRGRGRSSGGSPSARSWIRDVNGEGSEPGTTKAATDTYSDVVASTNSSSRLGGGNGNEKESQQHISDGVSEKDQTPGGLVRLGSNKLVLSNNSADCGHNMAVNGFSNGKVTSASNASEAPQQATAIRQKMIQKGANKLVLSNPKKHNKNSSKSWNKYTAGESVQDGEKGKRPRPRSSANTGTGPAIKRVKINDSLHQDDNSLSQRENSQGDQGAAGIQQEEGKSLTKFAYRETANRSGSSTMKRGGGRGNMGLVRVNPAENTPICPTFLRGIQCEDELCRKRHDVPRESAMPICSFFQRHGQCLKGSDCKFRHVKVNPLATICPSFSLLGYCNDKTCTMKHVTATNSGTLVTNGKRSFAYSRKAGNTNCTK